MSSEGTSKLCKKIAKMPMAQASLTLLFPPQLESVAS